MIHIVVGDRPYDGDPSGPIGQAADYSSLSAAALGEAGDYTAAGLNDSITFWCQADYVDPQSTQLNFTAALYQFDTPGDWTSGNRLFIHCDPGYSYQRYTSSGPVISFQNLPFEIRGGFFKQQSRGQCIHFPGSTDSRSWGRFVGVVGEIVDTAGTGKPVFQIDTRQSYWLESCLSIGGREGFKLERRDQTNTSKAVFNNGAFKFKNRGFLGFRSSVATNRKIDLQNNVAFTDDPQLQQCFYGLSTAHSNNVFSHNASSDGTHPGSDGVTVTDADFVDFTGGNYRAVIGGALDGAAVDLTAKGITTYRDGTPR